MSDETHHVNESADKITLTTKIKRGSGTRDQDELLIEGRGEDAAEAAEEFETALLEAEVQEWADRLRDIQPEGNE